MKYKNAAKILPEELIEKLQEYVQGEYLYIPIKEREMHPKMTDYALEVEKRDGHIYSEHLQGLSNRELAERYKNTERILKVLGSLGKRSVNGELA